MTTDQTAYTDALNDLAATVVMGWHERDNQTGHYTVWANAEDQAQCACRRWNPTQSDARIGELLGKALRIIDVWSKDRSMACKNGEESWRVALVKALIVACGGTLPEEVEA